MVPEIWSATDRIFMSARAIFFLFYPPNSPKNENIKKMKNIHRDVIIFHKCTKNHDHKLYCSCDMACDGCTCYFSFWAIFCPFTPLTAQKMKISKNGKSVWRYHYFTQIVINLKKVRGFYWKLLMTLSKFPS